MTPSAILSEEQKKVRFRKTLEKKKSKQNSNNDNSNDNSSDGRHSESHSSPIQQGSSPSDAWGQLLDLPMMKYLAAQSFSDEVSISPIDGYSNFRKLYRFTRLCLLLSVNV
jgi:hypothetical protein